MDLRNLALLKLVGLLYCASSFGQDLTVHSSDGILPTSKSADLNSSIYYDNKLEFSLETGWLPFNIPFVFDCFLGDSYNETPLQYTLVPTVASLRWQMGDVRGPGILRGTCDLSFSGAFTRIPRGPETHYWAYDTGIRRNFV